MWLFLSVWTFNFICTLTALLMVWVYEIAAPVSWVLVVPSLAFDIWRLATPDDYAKDGPHHPIWHSPTTVLRIYMAFCIFTLLVAPLFAYSCFAEFNRLVEPYFGFAHKKLVQAGGVCEAKYGNFIILYFLVLPFLHMGLLAYLLIICKRDRKRLQQFKNFDAERIKQTQKDSHAFVMIFFVIAYAITLKYIPFDSYGSRTLFVPGDYLFSFGLMQVFHLSMVAFIGIICSTGSFLQIRYESR